MPSRSLAQLHRSLFEEGFLGRRSLEMMNLDFSSSLLPDIAGSFSLCLEPRVRGGFEIDTANSEWGTRGWVWQEQMLARRLLLFGRAMVRLKCNHLTHSDDDTIEYNVDPPYARGRDQWFSWVRQYTEKNLTKHIDRLPAISGVAKMGDRFCHDHGWEGLEVHRRHLARWLACGALLGAGSRKEIPSPYTT
ncbi:unnamed protein product [Discula destructiva]